MKARKAASRLLSGSSRRKISGSVMAERPMATFCSSLTLSFAVGQSSRSSRRMSLAMAATRRATSSFGRPRTCRPNARFLRTVRWVKMA